jgi:hypothetical protein
VLFHNEKETGRTMARRQVNFWRNHQKTIAGVKMSQAKPHAEHPPPPTPSQSADFGGMFSTWPSKIRLENTPEK